MRKIIMALMISLLVVLTACGGGDYQGSENVSNNNDESGISVDKGILSNTITLPLDFLYMGEEISEEDIAELRADIEENGAQDVQMDDNKITFKISKKDHKQMMDEMRADIEAGFTEYVDGDEFVSFQNIKANNDFSKIDVTIDVVAFEEAMFEGFIVIALGISSVMYQAFDGVDADKLGTTIHLLDEETGDIYETIKFPEVLEEIEETEE